MVEVDALGDGFAFGTAQNVVEDPIDFAVRLYAAADGQPKMFDDESGEALGVRVLEFDFGFVVVEGKVAALVFRKAIQNFRENWVSRAAGEDAVAFDSGEFRDGAVGEIGAMKMARELADHGGAHVFQPFGPRGAFLDFGDAVLTEFNSAGGEELADGAAVEKFFVGPAAEKGGWCLDLR